MVACQVFGNHSAIIFAGVFGPFELNVFKSIMISNLLSSIRLLADGANSFRICCADGVNARKDKIEKILHESLMLVTDLNPKIGYDMAFKIAKNIRRV
jgi:fumarate hydratase class II